MYGVNSCRHPRHPKLMLHWFVCVHCGLFFVCRTEKQQQFHQPNCSLGSRTIVPLTAFVCGVWETGNEIMLRAPAVCAHSLSKSGARPRREYQSLISRPHKAYGNEEKFIQCNVSKQGGIYGWTRHCHPSSSSHSLDSNPPIKS